ncbi:MAG: AAA family ATPase [Sulfurovum sp.]|nr:AAA family ATPase [Sulfurovum sp.]MCB4759031.1 AAA family ATPase [Sulfurovum sp.]MCB4760131.1 AAA family ATPase [Sulfurovum sp.]MCB4761886.1 AAA family ATPase [Sulfurovum sp.]MCB4763916.1 AAA family ATPase [Sulfurovum sp.]
MIDDIQNTFLFQLNNTSLDFKRYMHDKFDMNDRLIGIIGSRGVGKSTFILQYLKELDMPFEKKLYFNADHFEVMNHSIYEIAKEFHKRGGEILAIDEIHKYPNFEIELKSIYDSFELKVIFSGSSALTLENAKSDLSRRAYLYRVNGLSFREFLAYEAGEEFDVITLEELLQNHTEIAYKITQKIKPFAYFSKYLQYGYYPFYKENINHYQKRLLETINIVMESDLPIIFNIEPKNIYKLKKLLTLLCISKPYELNISKLSQKIGINRQTLYLYLHYLEMGGLTKLIKGKEKGDSIFTKPEKLYLNNTNLNSAYCQNSDSGTIREEFFVNQLQLEYKINYHDRGDFIVDEKYLFEIGGKNKSFKQIKDVENSFVVADDIEVGSGAKIPLWLFGFLY